MMLGSVSVLAVRLLIPWTGAWVADCDLDLDSNVALPTGKQSLVIGSATILGTVDARGTGRLGDKARCRIVAGAGAWGNPVTAQHFHNDAPNGVMSTQVLNATASQIGETVIDPSPVSFGPDFVRTATEQASQVLAGRDWYVDAKGITQIAQWPTSKPGATVEVLDYDPENRIAEVASDEIVWPGTTLTDVRFGTITARDVDQSFSGDKGSRATVYHSGSPTSRLGAALTKLAGTNEFLKLYRYRIVSQGNDGRVKLQAVSKVSGVPDTLPVSVWPGLPGFDAKFTPATICLVGFIEGDKTQPKVFAFDDNGTSPIELHFDATTRIKLGAAATDGAALATPVQTALDALMTFAYACSGASIPQAAEIKAAAATLITALGGSPAPGPPPTGYQSVTTEIVRVQ